MECDYCAAISLPCQACGAALRLVEVVDIFHISEQCQRCKKVTDEPCPVRTANTDADEAMAKLEILKRNERLTPNA